MNPATKSLPLTVYPNPFDKKAYIRILASQYEEGSISMFNIYGQAIQRQRIQLIPGINKFEMETEETPAGLYYLHYATQITRLFIIIKLRKN